MKPIWSIRKHISEDLDGYMCLYFDLGAGMRLTISGESDPILRELWNCFYDQFHGFNQELTF